MLRNAALALVGYLLLSLLVFGRGVPGHLESVLVGFGPSPRFDGRDQGSYVWFLAWGAHVLAHPQNPLFTHAIYVPRGYNLAWAGSIPGPALLLSPVTALIGAISVFNLLALLAPACSAWTAYLLCAQLSRRMAPALIGGLLFGFGTYETAETVNHLNLALIALLPLFPLLALRRHRGLLGRRWYVLAVGVLAGVQLWTSTEIFASAVVFGALALVLALLLAPADERAGVRRLAAESLGGLALAVVIGAPVLVAALGPNPVSSHPATDKGADLANLIIPTEVTWVHGAFGHSERSLAGNLTEQLGYLGPVLLLVLAWFAIGIRRSRLGRGVLLFALLAAVLSLGGELIFLRDRTGVPLPWALIGWIPPLNYALPGRFSVYVWLAVAVAVAVSLREPSHTRLRWAAALAACASVFPNATGLAWATHVDAPALLKDGRVQRYVRPGSTVIALPFGINGNSMLWQVQSGFSFRLAGGYASFALPAGYSNLKVIEELMGRPPRRGHLGRLCSFIRWTGASTILLREHAPGDWHPTLAALKVDPVHDGGFAIYSLKNSSCTSGGRSSHRAVRRRF
jgi:hypothetical protein